jgi:hypothetical protein
VLALPEPRVRGGISERRDRQNAERSYNAPICLCAHDRMMYQPDPHRHTRLRRRSETLAQPSALPTSSADPAPGRR